MINYTSPVKRAKDLNVYFKHRLSVRRHQQRTATNVCPWLQY